MTRGIILFGAAGSGKTTIAIELAQRLNFWHLDLDDYHWRWDTEIPYTTLRPAEERIKHIMDDISQHANFVMSGNMWSIRKKFEPLFDLAVLITAPVKVRAERIRSRELAKWSDRILPGGDMYEANPIYSQDYIERVSDDFGQDKQHEAWAKELPCPVLTIEGTAPIEESVVQIYEYFRTYRSGC